MRVIEGDPLSIDTIVEGVYKRYTPELERGKYIIGVKEQNPLVLLLNPKAILVKYGGLMSHLAIVCRELNIPLYRVDVLDDITDGSYIVVVPKVDTHISNEMSINITFFGYETNSNAFVNKIANILRELYERFGIKSSYDIEKVEENKIHIIFNIHNVKDFLNEAIKNPNRFIEVLDKDLEKGNLDYAVAIQPLGEVLLKYLIKKYGLNRIKDALPPCSSVWSKADDSYFEGRFEIKDKKIIETIRYLSSITRKEYKPLEGLDQDLLMLAYKIMVFYESKNLKRK